MLKAIDLISPSTQLQEENELDGIEYKSDGEDELSNDISDGN